MFSVEYRRNGDEVTQIMSGPKGCTETSVRDYNYTLRNMPEDVISQGDTNTMVIIQFYSCSEIFSFQKVTFQAPYIIVRSVSIRHSS
jgi:hypothetical protein